MSVSALINDILKIGEAQEDNERKLLSSARALVAELESPYNVMLSMSKAHIQHAALRSILNLKVIEAFSSEPTLSVDEIAERTGAEPLLVHRLMRLLATNGIFTESAEETYSHNRLSSTLKDPTFRTWVHGHTGGAFSMSKLPEFLESISWRNPVDSKHALFQFASGGKQDLFSWLQVNPVVMKSFSSCMAASTVLQAARVPQIMASILPRDADKDVKQVLCIDIGGGSGQMLSEVRQFRPELKGRMIVQDLPKEIEDRVSVRGVEGMSYSFFDPQPIRGAYLYILRHIMHDWPPATCAQILRNQISAMSSKSRIIIVDIILPNKGVPQYPAALDVNMMVTAGMERTERQWFELLEGVGLKILSIRGPQPGGLETDSFIECSLVEVNGHI